MRVMVGLRKVLDVVDSFLQSSSVAVSQVLRERARQRGIEDKKLVSSGSQGDDDFSWFDELELDQGGSVTGVRESS